MNMVIPDEGKLDMLEELYRSTGSRPTFTLDLFVSNTTVSDTSTAADFTLATFTGYAQIAIARGDWSAAAISAHVGSITKAVDPAFTCTGGSTQTAYGWILRSSTSGKIWQGQNFDIPRVMAPPATETISPLTIKDKTFT